MSGDVTTLRVRIEGRVQGVGFRDYAVQQAVGYGLKGWVRNRADGAVEALVTGDVKDVEAFVQTCMKGPPGAKVKNLDLISDTHQGVEGFIVLPDA